MPAPYPFIDIAVLDAVRGAFVSGAPVLVLDEATAAVAWANVPGARLLDMSVEEAIGTSLASAVARRQIEAVARRAATGRTARAVVRLNARFGAPLVPLDVSIASAPDKARLVVLVAETAGPLGEVRDRAILDVFGDDVAAALLDDGGTVHATGAFDALSVDADDIERMRRTLGGESDRLVKRVIGTRTGSLSAGMARLADAPRLDLLLVVDPSGGTKAAAGERAAVHEGTAVKADVARQVGERPAGPDEKDDTELQAEPVSSVSEPVAPRQPASFDEAPSADKASSADASATEASRTDAESDENTTSSGNGTGGLPGGRPSFSDGPRPDPETMASGEMLAPLRFTWTSDAAGAFVEVSEEFTGAVGMTTPQLAGRDARSIEALLPADRKRLAAAMSGTDPFTHRTVAWAVPSAGLRVPVAFSGVPQFDHGQFEGHRGHGLVRLADAVFEDEAGTPEEVADTTKRVAISTEEDEPILVTPQDRPEPASRTPALTEDERRAFDEIASVLGANGAAAPHGSAKTTTTNAAAAPDATATTGSTEPSRDNPSARSLKPAKSGVAGPSDDSERAPETDRPTQTEPAIAPSDAANDTPGESESDGTRIPKSEPVATAAPDRQDTEQGNGEAAAPQTALAENASSANDESSASDEAVTGDNRSNDNGSAPEASSPASDDRSAAETSGKKPPAFGRRLSAVKARRTVRVVKASDRMAGGVEINAPSGKRAPDLQDAEVGSPDRAQTDTLAAAQMPAEARTRSEARSRAEPPAPSPFERVASPRTKRALERMRAAAEGREPERIEVEEETDDDAARDVGSEPTASSTDEAFALLEASTNGTAVKADDDGAAVAIDEGAARPVGDTFGPPAGESPPVAEGPSDGEAPSGNDDRVADAPFEALEASEAQPAQRRPATIDTTLLGRLPIPVLVQNADGLLFANEPFLKLTGFEDLPQLIEAGGMGALFDTSIPTGSADRAGSPVRIRRRDGTDRPVHAQMQTVPWAGEDGSEDGSHAFLLTVRPTDERGRSLPGIPDEPIPGAVEERLRSLNAVLDEATDGVVFIDAQRRIRSLSRRATALLGYASDEVEGRSFAILFAPESQRRAVELVESMGEGGPRRRSGIELDALTAADDEVPLFVTVGAVRDDGGYCAVLRDISEWRRTEGELRSAREIAEAASRQKSRFLARVSHEIRTPLNAIIGFAEVMAEERFGPVSNPRYREYLADIRSSGRHVLDLVNDLLDIAKIEAGRDELRFEEVDLNAELRAAISLIEPQAEEARVIVRPALGTVPPVVADRRSVKQIILNILSNAVRYTEAGGQVIVSTKETEEGVSIRVRDTGVGMSQDDIDRALEPFAQVPSRSESMARRSRSGTGLGLPLSKAMAEANRAAFSISSVRGRGTLVELTFPPDRVLD